MEEKFNFEKGLTTERLSTLVDGIFAIAMTLLAFKLSLPESYTPNNENELINNLLSIYPHFIHYVLSFLLLGLFWIAHHRQFQFVVRLDKLSIWINILILLFICLIPFSASLVSEYSDLSIAAIFFETNLFIIGILYLLFWRYATENFRLIDKNTPKEIIKIFYYRGSIIPIVSVLGIILSLIISGFSTIVYIAVPVLLAFFGKIKNLKEK